MCYSTFHPCVCLLSFVPDQGGCKSAVPLCQVPCDLPQLPTTAQHTGVCVCVHAGACVCMQASKLMGSVKLALVCTHTCAHLHKHIHKHIHTCGYQKAVLIICACCCVCACVQMNKLLGPIDVVVSTPTRLLQSFKEGHLHFRDVQHLVSVWQGAEVCDGGSSLFVRAVVPLQPPPLPGQIGPILLNQAYLPNHSTVLGPESCVG